MDLKIVLFYQRIYKLISENIPIKLTQFTHMQRKQDQFAKTNKTLQSPQSLIVKKSLHTCPYTQKSWCGLEIIMWGNEMLFFYIIKRLPIIDTKIYVQKHFSPT